MFRNFAKASDCEQSRTLERAVYARKRKRADVSGSGISGRRREDIIVVFLHFAQKETTVDIKFRFGIFTRIKHRVRVSFWSCFQLIREMKAVRE